MTVMSDQEIALLVQNGKKDAYGLLIERYEDKIFRYGRRFLLDTNDIVDIVQDVFIKAYININEYDCSRSFSSWIYRIAHNEYINKIKKKKSVPFSFFEWNGDLFFPHPVANEKADAWANEKFDKEMVEKILQDLAPKYREIIILSFFEELSYQEISDILRIPISTVGVRLRRAKATLKKIYEKQYGKHK